MTRISIKSRLLLMLLGVSAASILIVAFLSYRSGQEALEESVFQHLTSVRASKAYQIQSYFEQLRAQTEAFGEDCTIAEAMVELQGAYAELADEPIPAEWDASLSRYYTEQFLPQLAKNVGGTPSAENYAPEAAASRYLQYHYLANNPNPGGEKHLLDEPGDGSHYSRLHARYQPIFRKLIDKFGYYDMFLIDVDSGDIVYSTFKEVDFATSLISGPYKRSSLARAMLSVQGNRDKGYVKIADYAPYRPSFAIPAAFISTPIYQEEQLVGVLAFQISADEIDRIMTGNRNWAADGLGESGETYLVGSDHLMRSVSRFLTEDPEGYAETLRGVGGRDEDIARILRLGTSILEQEVRSEATEEALVGKSGTRVVRDYRGVPVLSSYAPLDIVGLKWAILSEMDLAEASAAAQAFAREVLIAAGVVMILITFAVMALASSFVRPINRLISGIRAVGAGRTDVSLESDTDDEYGELAHSFNEMVSSVRAQSDLVEQRSRENEELLGTILPPAIAKRIKQGEATIADDCESATVLFSDLEGFTQLARTMKARESVALLNEIVSAFDEAADEHGVEKIKTLGDGYMAACGVSMPRLDHVKRMVDFAREIVRIVDGLERERGMGLGICVGVHTGPLVAGIVGRRKFVFDLWGDTVNHAHRLKNAAAPGEVRVSDEVRERLRDLYAFEPVDAGPGKAAGWRLGVGNETSARENIA